MANTRGARTREGWGGVGDGNERESRGRTLISAPVSSLAGFSAPLLAVLPLTPGSDSVTCAPPHARERNESGELRARFVRAVLQTAPPQARSMGARNLACFARDSKGRCGIVGYHVVRSNTFTLWERARSDRESRRAECKVESTLLFGAGKRGGCSGIGKAPYLEHHGERDLNVQDLLAELEDADGGSLLDPFGLVADGVGFDRLRLERLHVHEDKVAAVHVIELHLRLGQVRAVDHLARSESFLEVAAVGKILQFSADKGCALSGLDMEVLDDLVNVPCEFLR
jgi:hypothetical protein